MSYMSLGHCSQGLDKVTDAKGPLVSTSSLLISLFGMNHLPPGGGTLLQVQFLSPF